MGQMSGRRRPEGGRWFHGGSDPVPDPLQAQILADRLRARVRLRNGLLQLSERAQRHGRQEEQVN